MNLAIMQPYLFPYLGYFQLLEIVDKFVFYDDVNFIKNGWINRNRLLLSGETRYFTIPLAGASPFLKIDQITVCQDKKWRRKILESVRQSYSKAPNFNVVNEIFSEIINLDEHHISEVAKKSVIAIAKYLELSTEFVMSSSCYENADLSGVARVIDICHKESADAYYNLIGGKGLYLKDVFQSHGISLNFTEPVLLDYEQNSKGFHPGLSIIDALMFNDKDAVCEMLKVGNCS